jgi:hypothetical protein
MLDQVGGQFGHGEGDLFAGDGVKPNALGQSSGQPPGRANVTGMEDFNGLGW